MAVAHFGDDSVRLAVIGIGRVGLPLAVAFAQSGLLVTGVDRDEGYLQQISTGTAPFREAGLDEALVKVIRDGNLSLTVDGAAAVSAADAVIVCVGTPLSAEFGPDYAQLRSGLESVTKGLGRDKLIVMRSTVSPGTVTQVVQPHLEKCTGLTAGEDFLLAVCPERVAEGRALEEVFELPEIVGGVNGASSIAASQLFGRLSPAKKIRVTDPTSAELAKLFTNVYRYVNFALSNEYAYVAEQYGRDAIDIIDLVNADYPRGGVAKPGPAAGPCLFKDGYFLIEQLNMPDFVLMAWKLNESVPVHVARRVIDALERKGKTLSDTAITVLGRGFKRDSDDDRYSPSLKMIDVLARSGADVTVHDPSWPGVDLDEAITGRDAIVLATNHSAYDDLEPGYIAMRSPGVVIGDCWGVFDRGAAREAGVQLVRFGNGEAVAQ